MWPELREEVELELELVEDHLKEFAPLRSKALNGSPDHVEILALGAMLHSFYNGVENIFKRVAHHCNGKIPEGGNWHQKLLQTMAMSNSKRPEVVSESLAKKLRPYLDFRHFFRHAYSFQIRWAKMKPLVENCDTVFKELKQELKVFLNTIKG